MSVRFSLPEVLVTGSCVLFCFGEYVAGTVFFVTGLTAGFVRTSTELQAVTARQALVNRVLEMVSAVGSHLATVASVAEMAERVERSSRGDIDSFN